MASIKGSPLAGPYTHGIQTAKKAEGGIAKMTAPEIGQAPPQVYDGLRALSSANRPPMATQQSSSVPSTPFVCARRLSDDERPSTPLNKTLDLQSPRSARSESDGTLRPPGRTPFLTGCKYETGMAYSRRRIPYALGGDKLDPSPVKVKKHLDPADEEKLSGDMRELYDRILPTDESEDRRARFVAKLEKILNDRWPGNNIEVHVFGSSGNLLYTNDSDGTLVE